MKNKFMATGETPHVPAASSYAERQFLHTYLSGAFLPLTQATITAMMMMVLTGVVLYLFDALDYVKPMLVVFCVTWVVTWFSRQRRWLSLTDLESRLKVDLNGDGVIGAKPVVKPDPLVIRLDESHNGNFRSRRLEYEVTREQLVELAEGLVNGVPFTEREWTGRGRPFSSAQFRKLRMDWLKQEIIQLVSENGRNGFDFTESGWALICELAGIEPKPVEEE